MKSFFITLILSTTFAANCFAYIPTLESLLRNAGNPDLGTSSLAAKIKLFAVGDKGKSLIVKNNQTLKYYLYNGGVRARKLVQLKFAASSFKLENLYEQKVFNFSDLNYLERNKEKVEQRFYYSVLAMLLGNNGSFLMDFLKDLNFPIKQNKDLINSKKKYLLNRYTSYLKSGSGSNPLRSKNKSAQKRIDSLYNAPLLSEDGLVKRLKNGDHFSFVVDTGKLYISFTHDHHIEEFTFETPSGKFSAHFGRFILQGGGMEFPEEVTFSLPSGDKFKLELVSLKKFGESSRSHTRRLSANTQEIRKNNISISQDGTALTL